MRAPLTVRINDGVTDRLMSKRIKGLKWRKTAPGGHADASCRIDMPSSTFTRLGPNDRMWIYDTQGRTMWEGYTNNPGTQTGRLGQGFEISAAGGSSLASDEARALIYIDGDLTNWTQDKGGNQAPAAQAGQGGDPAGVADDGLFMQFPSGSVVSSGSLASLRYYPIQDAGMEFGAITVTVQSGQTDTGYRTDLAYFGAGSGSGITSPSIGSGSQIQTTAVTASRYVGSQVPVGATRVALRLRRSSGATNIGNDTTWTLFNGITILGRRVDRYGTAAVGLGMVTTQYVLASWVVEDLLGRVLTFCDPNIAVVDTTSYQIDQLAFTEGITAAALFEQLSTYEADFLWEILESNASGKFRFNYRAWPTTPRYLIPPSMPVEQPGSDNDLCNRIAVNWVTATGAAKVTVVTSSVDELGGAPGDVGARIRDADPVSLPQGRGSLANANQIGAQILAAKADPPKAATVVVDRPIMDLTLGRLVDPWEIEPGYLARVVATGDDMRLTEMEYDDDSCSSTLTLGDPVLTMEQRIARLSKVKK